MQEPFCSCALSLSLHCWELLRLHPELLLDLWDCTPWCLEHSMVSKTKSMLATCDVCALALNYLFLSSILTNFSLVHCISVLVTKVSNLGNVTKSFFFSVMEDEAQGQVFAILFFLYISSWFHNFIYSTWTLLCMGTTDSSSFSYKGNDRFN